MRLEERVEVAGIGQTGRNDLRLRAGRFGLGCGEGGWGAGLGGGAFGVGQGCRAGAHLGAVDPLKGEQSRSG
ncbi:hypothetical protein ACFYZJ_30590 [Streptomyces sp. NPDC001848]|uniref:hypothetical protein n=1 Tax=Streptomyces sp. NPDC001848 TaxID=3364618 RepID=UPI003686A96F